MGKGPSSGVVDDKETIDDKIKGVPESLHRTKLGTG